MNDHSKDTFRLVYRIIRDGLLIVCSATVYFIFHITFNVLDIQNKTGFYCSNKNLWYPYRTSTVPTKVLLLYINTLLPIIIFTLVEGIWNTGGVKRFYGFNIPLWIPQIYNRIVQYVFGYYWQISFMLFPKFFDAPHFLRPHFMAVCQPLIGPNNLTCSEISDPNLFITDYVCKSDPSFTKAQLQNAFWTFPSGHTSGSFFTAIYLILYLHDRVRSRKVKEIKMMVQLTLIIMAIGVGISRLQDNYHHGVDVISGAIMGTVLAVLSSSYFNKLFPTIRDISGFTNHGIEEGIGTFMQEQQQQEAK